ncbi:hypothetical protein VPG91_00730 [Nitrospirillum amazonense]|uniref:hypothetical protein n=1 Tax=Nitrospirillum amazonense TaxID=28077 RepID=UPI002DD45232|nr:hypothetical protein [Nitrospirillum amazonense]MEC4589500.1 hypothetical protein [Nitrospirillum amazonense]
MNKRYLAGVIVAAVVVVAAGGAVFISRDHFPNQPTGFEGIAFGDPIQDHVRRLGLEEKEYSGPEAALGVSLYEPDKEKISPDHRGEHIEMYAFEGKFFGAYVYFHDCGDMVSAYHNKYGKPKDQASKGNSYSYYWNGGDVEINLGQVDSSCLLNIGYIKYKKIIKEKMDRIKSNY